MIEIEGIISNQPISILIDPGASLSYISPHIVEKSKLKTEQFQHSWLVQLATGTKLKVTHQLKKYAFNLNRCIIDLNLNVLPLGSYDLLVCMDWMEQQKAVVNCLEKKKKIVLML